MKINEDNIHEYLYNVQVLEEVDEEDSSESQ